MYKVALQEYLDHHKVFECAAKINEEGRLHRKSRTWFQQQLTGLNEDLHCGMLHAEKQCKTIPDSRYLLQGPVKN